MAPVVKRSLPEPTPGQSLEVPEHDDTETGSQLLSVLNRVTEASPVIGNVTDIFILENVSLYSYFRRSLRTF